MVLEIVNGTRGCVSIGVLGGIFMDVLERGANRGMGSVEG